MSAKALLKNKWVLGGLAVAAVMMLSKRAIVPANRPASGPTPRPAAVNAGEIVSASTFQRGAGRRAGMIYAPAQLKGNLITFRSPVRGIFTRNVIQQGNQLFAEIQRA